MSLPDRRRAIRHLLDEQNPADALASYLAFYHADNRTILRPYPFEASRAEGFVTLSRTGVDLFRPFVTMRLPIQDVQKSADIIYDAIDVGTAVILQASADYAPLLQALFDIQTEETLKIFKLDQNLFEPIINVFVTEDTSPTNNLPRFIIRNRDNNEIAASASYNWQTKTFAEVSVFTHPDYRRRGWGRSVVSAIVNNILANGRIPLYTASESNIPSRQLAERVGFVDTGYRQTLMQGILLPHP